MEIGKKQILYITGGIILAWILSWLIIDFCFYPITEGISEPDRFTQRGTFGDKFGAINSLFSGLALAGIIISIILQRQELKETRQEFKDQNFQTIFFNLLKTQQAITKEIECEINRMDNYMDYKKCSYNGRKFFQQSKTELEDLISGFKLPNLQVFQDDIEPVQDDYEKEAKLKVRKKQLALRKYGITTEDEFQRIKNLKGIEFSREIYNLFFEKHQYVIGHYFRHLYHILSFLSKEKKSRIEEASEKVHHSIDNEIKKFADFVQAQVSTYELFLLFYNALEYSGIHRLMIEFDFYKNIPDDVLISDEDKKALESYMEESKN